MTYSQFYNYFYELAINTPFQYNGNDYLKLSTRTAKMLDCNRTFYMGMRDNCYAKKDLHIVNLYATM